MVIKKSGQKEDAEDVFQEGVLALYQNIAKGKFEGQAAIGTYLFSICRNIWHNKLRDRHDESDLLYEQVDHQVVDVGRLNELLGKLVGDCKQLLKLFYLENKSMREIQRIFNLGSEQAAKNKKMRCMNSLMEIVKDKKFNIEQFFDE